MLKVKNKSRETVGKKKAIKELSKENDLKALYVKLPLHIHKRLKIKASELNITLSKLITSRIEEI